MFDKSIFNFTVNLNVNGEANEEMLQLLKNNNLKLNTIMSQVTDLIAKVDELKVSLDVEQAQVAATIAALEAAVGTLETVNAELQALVAEGGTVAERQELADKIEAVKLDLESTIADTVVTDPVDPIDPPVDPTV